MAFRPGERDIATRWTRVSYLALPVLWGRLQARPECQPHLDAAREALRSLIERLEALAECQRQPRPSGK